MERQDDRNKGLIVDTYSRNHQGDWIVPRRVMCAFFWVGIILLFTGIILLVTSKHKGVVYQSWGAVLLGLGFCLLLICLILCLHAYCVITVADEEDPPTPRRHVVPPPPPAILLANGRNSKPVPVDPYPPPPNGNGATLRRGQPANEVILVEQEQAATFRAKLSSMGSSDDSPRNKRRSTELKTRVLPTGDSFDNQCTCDINLEKRKSGVLTQALDDVLDDIDKSYSSPGDIEMEQETPLLTQSPGRQKRKSPKSAHVRILSYDDNTNELQAYDAQQSYRSFNDDVDRSIDKDLNIRGNGYTIKKKSPPRGAPPQQDDDPQTQVTPPVRFTDVAPTHGDIQVVPLGPPPPSSQCSPQLIRASTNTNVHGSAPSYRGGNTERDIKFNRQHGHDGEETKIMGIDSPNSHAHTHVVTTIDRRRDVREEPEAPRASYQHPNDGLIMIQPDHRGTRPPLERQNEREGYRGPPPSYASYEEQQMQQQRKGSSLSPPETSSSTSSRGTDACTESTGLGASPGSSSSSSTSPRQVNTRYFVRASDNMQSRLSIINEGYSSNEQSMLDVRDTQQAQHDEEEGATCSVPIPQAHTQDSNPRREAAVRQMQMTSIGVQYSPPPTPPATPGEKTMNRPPAGRRQQPQLPPQQHLQPHQTPPPPHPPSRSSAQRAPRLWTQGGNAPHGAAHVTGAVSSSTAPSTSGAELVPLPDVSLSKISLYDNVQYDMSALKKRAELQHFHF